MGAFVAISRHLQHPMGVSGRGGGRLTLSCRRFRLPLGGAGMVVGGLAVALIAITITRLDFSLGILGDHTPSGDY